jgi:hypothetical protein
MQTTRVAWLVGCAAWWIGVGAFAIGIGDKTIAGAWMFDKDDKGVAVDASANAHKGEVKGNVKWTKDGKFGGALVFEGNESWVSVPDHPSLQFPKGQDFTVAAWIKTTMSAGSPPMIVAKNYQPAETRPWYALYYANQAKALDGTASLFLRDAAGVSHHIAGGPLINDDKWHHLAGTREKATIRFYVDGKQEAEKGDADFDVGTSNAPLHFMSHLNRWLVGSLDEALIVRRALSDSEIRALTGSGIETFLAVEPAGKVSVRWGALKR